MEDRAVSARIDRIERNITRGEPLWSQDTARCSLHERMAYYTTPGLSVAVINRGEIEWARGYGVLESGRPEPVTADTIFQACSISKHVAMVAALNLAQDGKLDLDEDINRYLTSWKLPSNGGWQPRITPRQLLAHTAGLTQNWFRGFGRGEPTPTVLQSLAGQPPANTPPVRAVLVPGSQFRYSGSHYLVLQQLMCDITGAPFPELMRELVFEPLNMRNSSYDQSYPEGRLDSTAVGHSIGGAPVPGKWRILPEMAGAGLWTSPSDLALLAIEIQCAVAGSPSSFLKREMVEQALTPQAMERFGLGTGLDGSGSARRFGHSGDNIGYKCLSTAYCEQGMGAVIMTNGDDGWWVLQDLLSAIAEEYGWPDYLPNHTPIGARDEAGYLGEYELRPGFTLRIVGGEGRLYLAAAGQPACEILPSSEGRFFAWALNSEISFTTNANGVVEGLLLHQEGQALPAKKLR